MQDNLKTYKEFLEKKKHSSINCGIDVNFEVPEMFDYQDFVYRKLVKKGRGAGFLDTGTGKTLIELALAQNYFNYTQKPVLLITPLAVAFQHIKEAKKFGIDSIEYSKDGKYSSNIVVCNYERLNKFNSDDFDCVILDESSILKNFDGKIKAQINAFMKKTKYRFLFTATPSPNDFVELGTSSEALGYLGYTDMLGKFFTNNEDTVKPQNIGTKWILKGHAQENFFDWVSSWSISMRKPSDLGFSDERFILPELITNLHSLKNDKNACIGGQFQLFNGIAKSLSEVRVEQRDTQQIRCEKAVELASNHETSVYWVNFNNEGELIGQIDPTAYEIKGSMKLEKKEEILLAFADGQIKKLITKPKMTAFGLNWQHCNHTTYFPDFSYEKYYQAIRRFWRYGQKNPVTVDLIFSDGQQRVIDSLLAKAEKANQLFTNLNKSINSDFNITNKQFNKKVELPSFL